MTVTETVSENELQAVQEEQRISLKDRLQNVIESNIRLENRAKAGEVAIEIVRKGYFKLIVEHIRIKIFPISKFEAVEEFLNCVVSAFCAPRQPMVVL